MPYEVTRTLEGSPRIALHGEPPYCKALAPSAGFSAITADPWLVLAFAAWSKPDVDAVQTALDTAKHFGGDINLGLLPLDNLQQLGSFHPGIGLAETGPAWILLRENEVHLERRGLLTTADLIKAIEASGFTIQESHD